MHDSAALLTASRAGLRECMPTGVMKKSAEEGGCGVVGMASSVKIKGRHIHRPSVQMHNRGNGKGGGIAAAGLDPDYFGVTRQVLDECYLVQIAFLDKSVVENLESRFINPFFDVVESGFFDVMNDYRALGLDTRPPDVKRYFARVKPGALEKFAKDLPGLGSRELEDEFVWRNSFRINSEFYASLGEKKAFVLSHGRDLMILKIVGYAENVVQYYGIDEMPANIWIAHQRYPTKGRVWHPGGAHPFIGMNEALVHNGDFANYHSVTEYLRQRNMIPQFLTDTEVSVMLFDLWSRVYKYPLEYVIEALAPTTELDFDRLPKAKRDVYSALQAAHIHGSPDGPWFFIIAGTDPDKRQCSLTGITDTSMLRPQVFALYDGDVQIGLCASEKQAIDAALESLSSEDARFSPVADKYWNARGGSHTDGGAFVFNVKRNGSESELECFNKFGDPVRVDKTEQICDFSGPFSTAGSRDEYESIASDLRDKPVAELYAEALPELRSCGFKRFRWLINAFVEAGRAGNIASALEFLTLLLDRNECAGAKKTSAVRHILLTAIYDLLRSAPVFGDEGVSSGFHRVTWKTRDKLVSPVSGDETLVIDADGFAPEGADCDAELMVNAAKKGWKKFVVFNLKGQRFHACGFGPDSCGIRVDLYGSSGDYAGSGMDGCELHIHGDAQDQLGQILKNGKLVVHGNVGQTFMYGAKGGTVFVRGSAAGRPLINTVGRPRVVINGTCLDFLAESFMAGDPLAGGGFAVINGIELDKNGRISPLPLPYPGSNLFSLASGGALYIRDPKKTIVKQQLNGGRIVRLTGRDWDIVRPMLEENERLFGISLEELLFVDGVKLEPEHVYRKIMPVQAEALELPDEPD